MLPRVNRRRTAMSDGGGQEGQVSFVPGCRRVGALDAISSSGRDRIGSAPHLLKGDIIAASELRVAQFEPDHVGQVPRGLLSCGTARERTGQDGCNYSREKPKNV